MPTECSVDGCQRTARCKDLCKACYERQRRTGSLAFRSVGRPPDPRPFPLQPLLTKARLKPHGLVVACGMSGREVRTAKTKGLTEAQADRCAIRLGMHPSHVWPEWWDVEVRQLFAQVRREVA